MARNCHSARVRGLAAAVTVVVAAALAGAQQPGGRQGPSFRSGVDVVSLSVTAIDGTSHYVTDLNQEDFLVFEDGVKQDVTFFTRTQLPIALALLIDTSASMEDKLATAQEAAIGFAKKLRTEDVAEVIDFDSRVDVLQSFTNDTARSSRPSATRRPAARRRCTTRSTSRSTK